MLAVDGYALVDVMALQLLLHRLAHHQRITLHRHHKELCFCSAVSASN